MPHGGPYRPLPADRLVPPVDRAGFGAGHEGAFTVLEAGRTILPPVGCHDAGGRSLDPSAVPIQRPLGMPDQGPGLLDAVSHPALTITRLRGAVCVPGGIVLYRDVVLTESFSAPWEAVRHRHLRAAADGWHLTADLAAAAGTVTEPVLYLDSEHLAWFGHVLLDVLTRAWAVDYVASFLGAGDIRIVCSRPLPAFARTLIEATGVAPERILAIDRPIRCEQLLVATKALQIQHYVAAPAVRLWAGIRNRLSPVLAQVVPRLYVSRRLNPTRPLVEEAAIEALFVRHGFAVVHPERLDVALQVRLFAGARLIAGPSGSNMFNIAFQGRARAILLMASPLLVHYSEQFMHLGHAGAALDVVLGTTELADRGDVHAPWHLEPERLEPLVRDWVARHG